MPVARVRRVAAALTVAFLGLFLTAAPAAALAPWPTGTSTTGSTVWVGINNGGPDSILVKVTQGLELAVNITSGCGTAPPAGVTFAVCLPSGGYMAFATEMPPAPATD